jgi:hypothetical protein
MNGNPLAGDRTGGEPQPEAKEMSEQRVQDQSAVGLIAVKIQRHAEKHELNQGERERGVAPQRKANEAVEETSRHHAGFCERRRAALRTAATGHGGSSRLRSAPFSIREATDMAGAIVRASRWFCTIAHVALTPGLAKLSPTLGWLLLDDFRRSHAQQRPRQELPPPTRAAPKAEAQPEEAEVACGHSRRPGALRGRRLPRT